MTYQSEPAFPVPEHQDNWGETHSTAPGMALRDYLAAKAMQSLIVVVSAGQHCAGALSGAVQERTERKIALDAYAMADAMLRARKES